MSNRAATDMPYVRLGNSGLKVSRLILGTLSYGDSKYMPWILEEEEAIKHIKFAYDRGINTFDTANTYSNGLSETVLGNAIKKLGLNRSEIVVMTKVYFAVGSGEQQHDVMYRYTQSDVDALGYVNQQGLSRKHIFDSVKASLERLGLDYIDVLQCHRFDPSTPVSETMQALHDVVQAGYVRYIGMSSCYAWQYYAISHNLTPFIAMQNHHSLVYREEEREMFPTLEHFGVGIIPWSPLARGLVARPMGTDTLRGSTEGWIHGYLEGAGTEEIVKRVEEISKKRGVSMAQISLAWSMARTTAPVIGTANLKNLEDLLGAVHVTLSDEEIKYLEEPYKARSVFGHQ
ncbi:aryl-alcohol dehydrogenase [Artomyces pyxidatus]|uniref:Aryl-alcohol dehydrogenase n=1 Tax=Artomyces pyxidatus TaxID=48021 RepID=A0ACB8SMV8_9AGAM|nr:aryl-alcohol dehydrogenase [Artomyces pyxidatus]